MKKSKQEGFVIFFRGKKAEEGEAGIADPDGSERMAQRPAVACVPESFYVPQGHELELTLKLVTLGPGSGEAKLIQGEEGSILWKTVEPPDCKTEYQGETHLVLTEVNETSALHGVHYFYQVRVEYQGRDYYSPDPVVVNQGPRTVVPPPPGPHGPPPPGGAGGGGGGGEEARRQPSEGENP